MKEQKEKTKPTKKRVLVYYLVLAASLLIIAAITVGVIFAVRANRSNDFTLDDDTANVGSGGNDDDGGKKPDDGKNDDDNKPDDDGKDKPTGSDTSYGLPLENANVACGYEFRFDKTLIRFAVHQGMDFAAEVGDKVLAVRDGKVTKVVQDHILNENLITITHSDGVTSTYKYITAKDGLKVGDSVKKGDVIGTVATAGGFEANEGTHLHFEIKVNGRTADPDSYLELVEK